MSQTDSKLNCSSTASVCCRICHEGSNTTPESAPRDSDPKSTGRQDGCAEDVSHAPVTPAEKSGGDAQPVSSSSTVTVKSGESVSEDDELIAPCRCRGTCGLVHRHCLEKWLTTANQSRCEICGYHYVVKRKSQSFFKWLCSSTHPPREAEPATQSSRCRPCPCCCCSCSLIPDNRASLLQSVETAGRPSNLTGQRDAILSEHSERRYLAADIGCFVLLTPLASIASYLCAVGSVYYAEGRRAEAIGLAIVAAFLVTTYVIWLVLTLSLLYMAHSLINILERNAEKPSDEGAGTLPPVGQCPQPKMVDSHASPSAWRYHLQMWHDWQRRNQRVQLVQVERNDANLG